MSELIAPMTQEEQQRFLHQMYILLGKQVKRYHKHYHMGENSSVPTELAQELTDSVVYTLSQTGGVSTGVELEEALLAGQKLLEDKLLQAEAQLSLVIATAPQWQTECRWDALRCLERYLRGYDLLHLAHRIPQELFYPISVPVPDGVQGIDHCLFYLNVMWLENQIMAGAEEMDTQSLWDMLSRDICSTSLNQCEQLLINGIGKSMVFSEPETLLFQRRERKKLYEILRTMRPEQRKQRMLQAAERLCQRLALTADAADYARAAAAQLLPRLEGPVSMDAMEAIFP